MDVWYTYVCPECGMWLNGRRMLQPRYDGTMESIENGSLGENFKRYMKRHPDTNITDIVQEKVMARCDACGEMRSMTAWAVGKSRRVYAKFPPQM
ncbi:MAG: hypothetical protein IJS96_09785 [Schwartzia sp.]|nr:hypothetical protein [Schwartzia sp. (in: firmicutes)]